MAQTKYNNVALSSTILFTKKFIFVVNKNWFYVIMGSAVGGGVAGGAAVPPPPQILEKNFSIHTVPPDFGGFYSEMI